jgi:hypothetical protein
MATTVSLLRSEIEPAYEAFLAEQNGATFYHSLSYRNLLLAVTGGVEEYLVATNTTDGSVVGILPMMTCEGRFGTVINSLPFFGSHGGVLATSDNHARALWNAYMERMERPGVAAATVVENPFSAQASLPPGGNYEDRRIGQITPLKPGPEAEADLLKRIDGSTRRNINKSSRAGVSVAVENDAIDFLAQTHYKNMADIGGSPKPAAFFQALPRVFQPDRDFKLYVARIEGRPVAALLLFYFKQFVEYFTPVTMADYREAQPMAAILHQAMLDAALQGRSVWNWGGTWTSQTGVYRFKRKWGAEDRTYHYATHLIRPDLLKREPQELSNAYPWFYVLPFNHLQPTVTQ